MIESAKYIKQVEDLVPNLKVMPASSISVRPECRYQVPLVLAA